MTMLSTPRPPQTLINDIADSNDNDDDNDHNNNNNDTDDRNDNARNNYERADCVDA